MGPIIPLERASTDDHVPETRGTTRKESRNGSRKESKKESREMTASYVISCPAGKPLPLFVSAALASIALAPVALAAGPVGNTDNPQGLEATTWPDSQGISLLHSGRKRSPSGILYPYPWRPARPGNNLGDWKSWGSISAGGIIASGDDGEALFRNYTDWSDGFIFNSLHLALRNRERAVYGEVQLFSPGRDDALYRAEIGVLGSFRLSGFYDRIPRTYMNDAKTLFVGVGSDTLSLPAGLTPGGGDIAAIQSLLANQPDRRIRVHRGRSQVALESTPYPGLKLFGRYNLVRRKGEQSVGATLAPSTFFPGGRGSIIETLAPVDYRDHNFTTGLEFVRQAFQVNLSYQYSKFENDNRQLIWQNPFSGSTDRGRLALAPDNHAHNLRGEFGLALPWRGRVSGGLSWHSMRQDDRLLAPTINSDAAFADWNTTAGLSRTRGDARVDTLLSFGKLSLRPWRRVTLRAALRYFKRDNKTRYTALNPLNDEVGYIAEDGGIPPLASPRGRFRSIPFDYDRLKVSLGASHRFDRKTTANIDYAWERSARYNRERSTTQENRLRVGVASRALSFASLRASYELSLRRGSSYDANPNREFSDPALIGAFDPGLRKYDIANRNRHLVVLTTILSVADDMDVIVTGRFRDDDYTAEFGLRDERLGDINLEVDYQLTPTLSLRGHTSYANRRFRIASTTWKLNTYEDTVAVGGGLRLRLLKQLYFESDYDFVHTRERQLDPGGADFPNLRTARHTLVSKLQLEVARGWGGHLQYRYERGSLDDFQQVSDSEQIAGVASGRLFLGQLDERFSVHIVALGIDYRF